ncbi:hypothetical protein OEZ85_005149 [Tetradesmus obliquus]|uniref:Pyrroline-5-carboxylate reductase catalytic N-terminal domain-containing protein n=1 Tax=Tetradesmus obliquus TaxID=3088 RepID=A0ABY8UHD2_TETOB|nr:hypothetical protein OEZ85_005149 [Tetradesmus obliquus]
MSKVSLIGTGNVAKALGSRLALKGRPVSYGTRDLSNLKLAELKQQQDATVKTIPEAVDWADVLILAVPGMRDRAAAEQLASSLGPGVAGKVVIDATNPLTPYPGLEVLWDGSSGGELLQAALPTAHVFKAFNSMWTPLMQQPDALGQPISMMFAGPAGPGREQVADVISDVGFEPVYVGPIRYARNLEALAELWIHLAVPSAGFTQESFGMHFAFQVSRKEAK